jgi:hypothetical protein
VESALELRNIDVVLTVINSIPSPSTFTCECSDVVLICLLHQLAIDFAMHAPSEVSKVH